MYSSENRDKLYIDDEAASQADRVTDEDNSHVGYVGFSQQVPLNSLEASLTRGLPGKTIHTIHSSCDNGTVDKPVEPTHTAMYSLEDSANPTCETPHTTLTPLHESLLEQMERKIDGWVNIVWSVPDLPIENLPQEFM